MYFKRRLLGNTLAYAYNFSPYYSEAFKGYEDCWMGDQVDLDQFGRLPTLTKRTVKEEFEKLKSKEAPRLNTRINRSGGSTGRPTVHMQDEYFRQMDMANNLLFRSWCGVRPGSGSLFVAADERDYFGNPKDVKKKFIDALLNKHYFNAFRLNDDTFAEMADYINRKRPSYVQMYMSAAYEFSRFILRNGLRIASPRMVMCVAGTTHHDMLDVVERAFGTKVNARYGSRETGDMAGMCTNRQYHEIPFTHHIDILDDNDRPVKCGEPGHIAVTVLTNRAMPLIRYKIGDLGIWSEQTCNCGLKFRAIKKIVGRTGEVIRNTHGKIILPEIFIHLVGVALGRLSDDIDTFQVVQTKERKIEVRLVLRNGVDPRKFRPSLVDLEEKITKVLEDESKVETIFVNEIPRLPSGKYSYTLSDLDQE